MTILYKEVVIESSEQAEALLAGTLAYLHHSESSSSDVIVRSTASKVASNWWIADGNALTDSEMVGWTGLVPVEAEEEWAVVLDDEGSADLLDSEETARDWARVCGTPPSVRLVTPFVEKDM